jgi:hypothetical protein
MAEEYKEELTTGEEKAGEEPFEGWERGYRAWKLRFKEGKPRLGSLTREDVWEPIEVIKLTPFGPISTKIVQSDWEGEEKEPFEKTTKGLYFLKKLEDVLSQYPEEDIYGRVIPIGTYEEGALGYRSHQAKVEALFKRLIPCYICRRPARFFVHNNERFPLCERCFKKVEKLISNKGYTEEEVEELLQKLGEVYDAEILELEG